MVKVMTPEEMMARKALLQSEPESQVELDYQATTTGKKEKPFADLRMHSGTAASPEQLFHWEAEWYSALQVLSQAATRDTAPQFQGAPFGGAHPASEPIQPGAAGRLTWLTPQQAQEGCPPFSATPLLLQAQDPLGHIKQEADWQWAARMQV